MPTIERIREAARFLARELPPTPVERSDPLGARLRAPAWLKHEGLQRTGSFKVRGALWRLAQLTDDERRRGVITCSAGNHGKGVAYAAGKLGLTARVFVPSTIDEAKLRGMRELGAQVEVTSFPGFDETELFARSEARRADCVYVSAFDDDDIVAANGGTLALELLEQVPEVRRVVVPVGGGGLGAGVAVVLQALRPDVRLVAVQHELSPALALSQQRGAAVTEMPAAETLAGGVEGGIGAANFETLRHRLAQTVLVGERSIWAAVRWLLAEHQLLVEPTGAVPLAACLEGRLERTDEPTVVVLSGRNVSIASLRRILAEAD